MPPRKPRMTHSACLGWCFLATMVIMSILIFVTYALGQDHPFPFKTWEQFSKGTEAWPLTYAKTFDPCERSQSQRPMFMYQYQSNAGSIWVVFTDGNIFTASYFIPGRKGDDPLVLVHGRIRDGQVVIEQYESFMGTQVPCDIWAR
mgnify:CR=1 FL=1